MRRVDSIEPRAYTIIDASFFDDIGRKDRSTSLRRRLAPPPVSLSARSVSLNS